MLQVRISLLALAGALLFLLGCSQGPQYSEVTGTVKLQGKPLGEIQVEFWPESKGRKSTGITDAEGHYKLMADDGVQAGAVVGTHSVVLSDISIYGGKFLGRAGETVDMAQGKKPRIPPEFSDIKSTPLKKKQVNAGKTVIDFDL